MAASLQDLSVIDAVLYFILILTHFRSSLLRNVCENNWSINFDLFVN